MKTETIVLNREKDVTLTVYLQDVGGEFPNIPSRPAVLILPGGGYDFCSDREAEPIALNYLRAGYQAFILRYSRGENKTWPAPLLDYEEAMRMIRERSDEWKVIPDRIAVIGFSAGGHLAASAATMSENRPNAAILVYAVLDEESAKEWNPSAPDAVAAVDEKTCPCFLAASRTDSMVPVDNTIRFMQALFNYDISFESHVYSFAMHGFSLGDSTVQNPAQEYSARVKNWVDDSIGWLKEVFGDFGQGTLTNPSVGHYALRSHEDHLSVKSTVAQILAVPEGKAFFDAMMGRMGGASGEQEMSLAPSVLARFRLEEMLAFGGVPAETLAQIDAQLGAIRV